MSLVSLASSAKSDLEVKVLSLVSTLENITKKDLAAASSALETLFELAEKAPKTAQPFLIPAIPALLGALVFSFNIGQ